MKRISCLLALLAATAAPLTAQAEGASPQNPLPESLPPESSASPKGASPETATDEQLARAQALFLEARAALEEGKNEAALEAFRASYGVVASPNSHLFVARCLATLGDAAGAYREFGLVIEEARQAAAHDPKYAPTAEAAAAEQAELREKVGFVTVRLENAAADTLVNVAGETIPAQGLGEIVVNPGLVEVSAGSATQLVMMGPGDRREVVLTLAPAAPVFALETAPDTTLDPEASRKRMRTAAYIAGGLGAAGLATFAVAGSMARSQYATLQDECGGPCPASRQSDIDAGRRSQTIANVGLAVGAVGLGTGTVLYLMSRPKPQETPSDTAPSFEAEVAAGPSFIGVRGVFR